MRIRDDDIRSRCEVIDLIGAVRIGGDRSDSVPSGVVRLTFAFGITAPEGSVTCPCTEPFVPAPELRRRSKLSSRPIRIEK